MARNDGLQYLVEPFPKGMDKAGAVETDWASAEGALVDYNGKVEIPKMGPTYSFVSSIGYNRQHLW